jgi:hypothetical protein
LEATVLAAADAFFFEARLWEGTPHGLCQSLPPVVLRTRQRVTDTFMQKKGRREDSAVARARECVGAREGKEREVKVGREAGG